jgi:hydrogenase maturation protein HypF
LQRRSIIEGKILTVRGLTGFHFICQADKAEIVKGLRLRKRRPSKPLTVMFPSLELLKEHCYVDEEDIRLMQSSQSPIILVLGKDLLPKEVAEGINLVGVMLPYTPIHPLLLGVFLFRLLQLQEILRSSL